jgi:hypothetical protein
MEDERKPLFEIVEQTFGILGGLVNLVLMNESEAAYEIMYIICKIFYTTNQLYVAPFLTQSENIDPWITFFKLLLDRPVEAFLDSPH